MKKFDVLKAITDEEKFSDMVFNLIEVKKKHLKHWQNFLKRKCRKKSYPI